MTRRRSDRHRTEFVSTRIAVIVAVAVLGLLTGLFHYHRTGSAFDACAYCHAGVQTPVWDLASALVAPLVAAVRFVGPPSSARLAPAVRFSSLISRAPPVSTYSALSRERCAGLA